jgi:hypothetical protein
MPRPRLLALVALAMITGSTVPAGIGSAHQATPVASPAAAVPTTAIVVAATNEPLRAPGSDGADHLEYDLLVTNAFTAPVTLSSIEVLAPDGERLLRLAGEDLVAATQPLLEGTATEAIPASGTVAVVMDVPAPLQREVVALDHRIAYEVAPDAPGRSLFGSFEIAGPELPVDPRPVTVIAPPLRGDGWLAGNACCSPASVHRWVRVPVAGERIVKTETFAIDWVRLQDGKLFEGDGSEREQWFGFGAEVLAVADGTVVAVQEGRSEEVPLQPVEGVHAPGDYGGNFVTLEIAPGVYAFSAHLQPDSITVEVGDQVSTGQVLGLLGNTGNSTAPHLHFGLLDDPDPLVGESLPMAFDHWTLAGTIPLDVYLGADPSSDLPDLTPQGPMVEQSGTLQLFLDVADFG